MVELPSTWNTWCKNYKELFDALTAFGTIGAVVVVLWAAQSSKVKLKFSFYFDKTLLTEDVMVGVSIVNTGLVSAFINEAACCYLLIFLKKRKFLRGGMFKKEI